MADTQSGSDVPLVDRLHGPTQWGYMCLADGGFIHDDAPIEAANRITELEAHHVRTLSDHGRMLWREDREGHCISPDLCGEYETVRCGPCAIEQATAAGVKTLDPGRSYLPEVCRLNRKVAELEAHIAANEASMPTIWVVPGHKGYPTRERPMTPAEAKSVINDYAQRVLTLEAHIAAEPERMRNVVERHISIVENSASIGGAILAIRAQDKTNG